MRMFVEFAFGEMASSPLSTVHRRKVMLFAKIVSAPSVLTVGAYALRQLHAWLGVNTQLTPVLEVLLT